MSNTQITKNSSSGQDKNLRSFVLLFINGKPHKISGDQAFLTLSEYLRYHEGLTGTKIVCAEGDCGACTVLMGRYKSKDQAHLDYVAINSCITYPYLLDLCHIITVEGMGDPKNPHPIQQKMLECHGAQCGYCTPGFICAYGSLIEEVKADCSKLSKQKIKNYLTGNLCRCTGYEPIIEAGLALKGAKLSGMNQKYPLSQMLPAFENLKDQEIEIKASDKSVYLPVSLEQATGYLFSNQNAKKVSGATDLGVLGNKGKLKVSEILALTNIDELYKIDDSKDYLSFGAKVNLHQVEEACEKDFIEFSNIINIFASPQIKNKATLVGNVANGSPIGDSLPFLMVADAILVIQSQKSQREVNINDFYLGYKKFDLKDFELITQIKIPKTREHFKLYKVSTRKDLDISTVTMGVRFEFKGKKLETFKLAFGGVGPTVMRPKDLEVMAQGANFELKLFREMGDRLSQLIFPMSDLRGSHHFRMQLCKNLLLKFYDEVSEKYFQSTHEVSL